MYTVYNLQDPYKTEFPVRRKQIERHQTLREKILETIRDAKFAETSEKIGYVEDA